ncbi:unnamed protein product, partial [Phaeothamnion confervicola]
MVREESMSGQAHHSSSLADADKSTQHWGALETVAAAAAARVAASSSPTGDPCSLSEQAGSYGGLNNGGGSGGGGGGSGGINSDDGMQRVVTPASMVAPDVRETKRGKAAVGRPRRAPARLSGRGRAADADVDAGAMEDSDDAEWGAAQEEEAEEEAEEADADSEPEPPPSSKKRRVGVNGAPPRRAKRAVPESTARRLEELASTPLPARLRHKGGPRPRARVKTVDDLRAYIEFVAPLWEQYKETAGYRRAIGKLVGMSCNRLGELKRLWEVALKDFGHSPAVVAAIERPATPLCELIAALHSAGWKKIGPQRPADSGCIGGDTGGVFGGDRSEGRGGGGGEESGRKPAGSPSSHAYAGGSGGGGIRAAAAAAFGITGDSSSDDGGRDPAPVVRRAAPRAAAAKPGATIGAAVKAD